MKPYHLMTDAEQREWNLGPSPRSTRLQARSLAEEARLKAAALTPPPPTRAEIDRCIIDTCSVAGRPERAAAFIAAQSSPADDYRTLENEKPGANFGALVIASCENIAREMTGKSATSTKSSSPLSAAVDRIVAEMVQR